MPTRKKKEADVAEETETTEATEPRKRGRPRPDDVIARDEALLTVIDGEMTTQEIAEAAGVTKNLAYLSLYRLRRDGKVARVQNEATGAAMRHWQRTG